MPREKRDRVAGYRLTDKEKPRRERQHSVPDTGVSDREKRDAVQAQHIAAQFEKFETEEEFAARLKNRGIARKRRAKRRRTVAVSILFILAAGLWLLFAFGFKINSIRVSGTSVYDEPVLRAAFGHSEGDHLYSFRKEKAEQALLDALPYLEKVKIRRLLPGTVFIEVIGSTEKYCIRQGTVNLITTEYFKVLRSGDNVSGLVQLSGLKIGSWQEGQILTFADEEQAESATVVLEALAQAPIEGVREIDFSNIYEMMLFCDSGIDIALGTYAGMAYKLQLAAQAIAALPQGMTGLMDVSGAASGHKAFFTASNG